MSPQKAHKLHQLSDIPHCVHSGNLRLRWSYFVHSDMTLCPMYWDVIFLQRVMMWLIAMYWDVIFVWRVMTWLIPMYSDVSFMHSLH
jgi:hypothetical protein